jgi:acetyl-CoA carboxylase biotin carboxyl carrier protein
MDLTDADVTDILALLDSLPYDELDLQTPRFRLTLRRTPHGWTQSTQILTAPEGAHGARGAQAPSIGADGTQAPVNDARGERSGGAERAGRADGERAELVAVRAPLPGTFYRAPQPGAAPFVEVGSRVSADTVIGIVETMKLMNSVHAGVAGTVAEFCVQNAEFAAHGATLLRIRADT